MKPINSDQSNGSVSGGLNNWIQQAKGRKAVLSPDLNQPYAKWLIPNFFSITWGSRLTSECLESMIVGPDLTKEERYILAKMLFTGKKLLLSCSRKWA